MSSCTHSNRWSRILDSLRLPLVQAPMAGGATPPALVAAVSEAGGLGSLAGALLSPDRLEADVAAIRSRTPAPFAVNLFILPSVLEVDDQAVEVALRHLAPLHVALGLPPPAVPSRWCEDFAAQFETVLRLAPPVASFTFGVLTPAQVHLLHEADCCVVGTATSLEEGEAWVAAGADAVCAQGVEAGGHRGGFLGEDANLGTLALTRLLVQRLPVPVIAAGGIMDGAGMAAALALNASACQLGTAFLRCPECGIAPAWKAALATADASSTRLTRAFSGRWARGLENDYMRRMAPVQADLPAYPVMNALTGALRAEATRQGNTACMSLWAGQGVALGRALPVAELVATLAEELATAGQALAGGGKGRLNRVLSD